MDSSFSNHWNQLAPSNRHYATEPMRKPPARQKEIREQRNEQTSYGLRAITSGEWYPSPLAKAAAISAVGAL